MIKTIQKYKLGLIIGRFQPFHKGHAYLIKKSLESIDKIVIGIGSSNVTDDNNPYDFDKRKKMIEEFIKKENLEDRVLKIFPSEDDPSDDVWLEKTLNNVSSIDVVVGNNDWVNGIFGKAGIKVMKVDYYKRYLFEGWKIRKLMREGKSWQNRVPEYLIAQIKAASI